ncbi:hypothetical protein ACT80S_18400 [Ramlibacter sp. MAHUQ-53]|uniref:hypothetical protein n=1 Tax=unclassified Ramlibacter TaxID=2617605 RepID=UPI00363A600B
MTTQEHSLVAAIAIERGVTIDQAAHQLLMEALVTRLIKTLPPVSGSGQVVPFRKRGMA